MSSRLVVVCSVGLFFVATGCRAEASRGQCVVHDAETVIRIEEPLFESIDVVRRDGDPDALLLLTHENSAANDKRQSAIRLNLLTAERTADWVPYQLAPVGYKRFESGPPLSRLHPLLASKKLRFEYLGRRSSIPSLNRNYDGHWSVAKEEKFTGTRRIVFDQRPLLQQDFEDYTWLVGLEEYVQIEPDGDRIICLCTDDRGSWLAVFSKQKLEAESAKEKKPSQ